MQKKLLTADEKFSRWVKYTSILFIILFLYYLVADVNWPVTPQAMVERPVTKIAPQVSGEVVNVNVSNNQPVKAGQVFV